MRTTHLLIGSVVLLFGIGIYSCSDDELPSGKDSGTTLGDGQVRLDTSSADGTTATDGAANDAAPNDTAPSDSVLPTDCTGKADGTACGNDQICLKESCVTSTCRDGYVNTAAGEECEDGNDIDGDGCTRCRWDCKTAPDCDDGNICNGTETCDTTKHTCGPGTPAAAGIACQQSDGKDGECSRGSCVNKGCGNKQVDPATEECDDGNDVTNDGCEKDCKFSCKADGDCDDKNACNGRETCDKTDPLKPVCKPGRPVVCRAVSKECVGTCAPDTGKCNYPDADTDGTSCDTDCEDNDPAIFPGAPECADGKDNDCDEKTPDGPQGTCKCYTDRDGDGYAPAKATSITAVTCTKGYTRTAPTPGKTDCHDGNKSVFPLQRLWFTKPYRLPLSLKLSYDYNCNGQNDQRYRVAPFVACKKIFKLCTGSGWVGRKEPPACGTPAGLLYAQCGGPDCLRSDTKDVAQACR